MAKCEWCGKSFDTDEAEDYFESETWLLSYGNVKKCLCGECAVQAIEDQVDGVYFETCEKCGKTLDLIEDEGTFDNHFPWYNGTRLRDHWDSQILCAECAIDEIESDSEDDGDYGEDEDDGERLSVSDAAAIWASNGKDEDYMFGYTEEELEDAL
mgnify:CR=1 FL=1